MDSNLGKYQERAKKYWFVDGVAEISVGLICVLLAVIFGVQNMFTQSPLRDLGFLILAFLGAFAVRRLTQRIKENSTYPRTGYISYSQRKANKWFVIAAVAFTAVLLLLQVYLIINSDSPVAGGPLVGGLLFAFMFTIVGFQSSYSRFHFLAILSLLGGGILSLTGIDDLIGAAVLSTLIGVILLISGMLTRRSYLQHNPLPGGNDGN